MQPGDEDVGGSLCNVPEAHVVNQREVFSVFPAGEPRGVSPARHLISLAGVGWPAVPVCNFSLALRQLGAETRTGVSPRTWRPQRGAPGMR